MAAIAQSGLQEILILTGESRKKSTVEYIGEACKIAGKYFGSSGLEVYPMNSDEYAYLHKCGADYVTVFQETFMQTSMRLFIWQAIRESTPIVSTPRKELLWEVCGAWLSAPFWDWTIFRKDAFATGMHAWYLQKKISPGRDFLLLSQAPSYY